MPAKKSKKNIIKKTKSICPKCNKILNAEIFVKDNKVYISRTCKKHGKTEELYFGDYELYKKFEGWAHDGKGIENPAIGKNAPVCPHDCGLCKIHKSHTALGNIVVTNRCFSGDMEIVTPKGLLSLEELFDRGEKNLDEKTKSIRVKVLSWGRKKNKNTMEHAIAVHRLESPKKLLKIRTVGGAEIKLTDNHKILVDRVEGSKLIEAKNLKKGDKIYSPTKIEINEKDIDIFDYIDKEKFFVLLDENTYSKLRKNLKKKYGTIKKAREKLGIKYSQIHGCRQREGIPLKIFLRIQKKLKIKKFRKIVWHSNKTTIKNRYIDRDLAYLIGMIVSDGSVSISEKHGTYQFKIWNNNIDLLKECEKILKSWFPDIKINWYKKGNTHALVFSNFLLMNLLDNLGIKKIDKNDDLKKTFSFPEKLISSFLSGYFDGDGTVGNREVAYITNDEKNAKILVQLLRRCGIISHISVRKSCGFKGTKSYSVKINGNEIQIFKKKIISKHKQKIAKLNEIEIVKKRINSLRDHVPKITISIINEVINHHNLERLDFYNKNKSYLKSILKGKRNTSKQMIKKIIKKIKGEVCQTCRKKLNSLGIFLSNDFFLDSVSSVEEVNGSNFVYDISVNPTHLFVVNGTSVVSNCDLTCFYCFFYAKAMGYVYEPTLGQIRQMLKSMIDEKPVGTEAVQLTGGEPLLRDDILDIIRIAKEEGYDHVQLNTNGIRLANNPEMVEKIRKAGVNTIYLSFDGVTSRTNPKNHWEIPGIIRNCRKAGVGIVLVPTVINGVNDHEIGDILDFGLKHIDVVRGVNYQPVSLVGRISNAERKRYRITIPDVISRLENQTDGTVGKEDFFPVPTVTALTHFVEAVTKKPKYELTSHFACGAATYLFMEDGGRIVPLPRFVDVYGLLEYLDGRANDIANGKSKTWTLLKTVKNIGRFIDKEKQPKGLSLTSMMFNILVRKDYGALGALHKKSLFVGMMHFMDKFNFDVERVKRCCVHYAVPDGRILPFCTFNVIPELYRDVVQRKYSLSIGEWEKKTDRKLSGDFYKRDPEKMKQIPDNLMDIEI